jgi:putative serine protease PepD
MLRGTSAVLAALIAVAVIVIVAAAGGEERTAPVRPGDPVVAAGFQDTVARALPSVVQIESGTALGSGVVLDDDGHVVTNAHVVSDARRFRVTTSDGSRHDATLRGVFREGDLAVIEVEGARLRPAEFADSSRVQVGEIALAIGNPLGLRSSVTQGIVSSTSRTVGEGNGVALPAVIQTSAPINPGNSGGALVDVDGAVIGIPTLVEGNDGVPAAGIGFAISSNTVTAIGRQLAEQGRVVASARAWLGVELRSVPTGGAFVANVKRDGPASRAGIAPGDVIVSIEGRRVRSADEIAVALADRHPGDRVPLGLERAGRPQTVQVTLGELPSSSE